MAPANASNNSPAVPATNALTGPPADLVQKFSSFASLDSFIVKVGTIYKHLGPYIEQLAKYEAQVRSDGTGPSFVTVKATVLPELNKAIDEIKKVNPEGPWQKELHQNRISSLEVTIKQLNLLSDFVEKKDPKGWEKIMLNEKDIARIEDRNDVLMKEYFDLIQLRRNKIKQADAKMCLASAYAATKVFLADFDKVPDNLEAAFASQAMEMVPSCRALKIKATGANAFEISGVVSGQFASINEKKEITVTEAK